MSFTDVTALRLHLLGSPIPSQRVYQIPLLLQGLDWSYLPTRAAIPANELVYSENAILPTAVSVVLNGTQWSMFDGSKLAYGSVSVCESERMDIIYTEGIDYVVDYDNGRIKRAHGSSIADNSSVYLIYSQAQVYSHETDYEWSSDGSAIRRRGNSKIQDPSFVLMDYDLAEVHIEDALLEETVAAAIQMIESRLSDPIPPNQHEPMLKEGATLLAAGLAALALAARPLQYGKDTAADDRSKQWLQLSDRYFLEAWKLLQPYLRVPERRGARVG
ncbi:MAG: hypothetical protein N2450_07800 [bacterium]|nr:hypothetical protein [bacterium]